MERLSTTDLFVTERPKNAFSCTPLREETSNFTSKIRARYECNKRIKIIMFCDNVTEIKAVIIVADRDFR